MRIYSGHWEHLPIKNRTEEVFVSIWIDMNKDSIQWLLCSKITELLGLFNMQVLETLWEIETQKELKKSKLKKIIDEIKVKISKRFSKKQLSNQTALTNTVALNCATLLKTSKESEEIFPPIFANLILNPENNWWKRILTVSLRSDDSWKNNFNIKNLIEESLLEIRH